MLGTTQVTLVHNSDYFLKGFLDCWVNGLGDYKERGNIQDAIQYGLEMVKEKGYLTDVEKDSPTYNIKYIGDTNQYLEYGYGEDEV